MGVETGMDDLLGGSYIVGAVVVAWVLVDAVQARHPMSHGRWRRPAGVLASGSLVLLAVACASNSSGNGRPGDGDQANGLGVAASQPAQSSTPRTCQSAIYSSPHDPDAWQTGPPARILDPEHELPRLGPADMREHEDGTLPVHKFVLEVSGAVQGPVELRVSDSDRSWLRLSYGDSASEPRMAFSEGQTTAVVEPCTGMDTQFNGGLVVRSTGCTDLAVVVGGTAVGRQKLSVGDSSC